MDTDFCPSHDGCQILLINGFAPDPPGKEFYRVNYCEAGADRWGSCKRFQTKNTLNLCPDFILPDSSYSMDDILDKLEEE